MRYLSLFSGVGGGDLGCQHLLGWECVGYVEWDEFCCDRLYRRIQDGVLDDAPIWCVDIREWNERTAEQYRGVVDIVTGGPPCQPFSAAGKQLGASDERNMWPAAIDTIRRIQPEWALLENVPRIVTLGYLDVIAADLHEIGYDARWEPLSAVAVGASQKREREWIVAHSQAAKRRRNGSPDNPRWWNEKTGGYVRSGWPPGFRSVSDIPRSTDGIAERMDRCNAVGNAQVPLVGPVAWDWLHRDLIA